MTDPLSLVTIQAEFSEDAVAWALQDSKSKKYVTIPHPKRLGQISDNVTRLTAAPEIAP